MPLAVSGMCHYHPGRAGIGVCVECRQVLCAECSTQFEGINRCASCLERMGRKAAASRRGSDWRAASLLSALVVLAVLTGVVGLAASVFAP
jgi:hypothetical protein